MSVDEMTAEEVAERSMDIAADMCTHTNKEFIKYSLDDVQEKTE